jgi:hypothetical protein
MSLAHRRAEHHLSVLPADGLQRPPGVSQEGRLVPDLVPLPQCITPSRGAAEKSGSDREAPFSGDQNGLENSQRLLTGHPGASSFRWPGHK